MRHQLHKSLFAVLLTISAIFSISTAYAGYDCTRLVSACAANNANAGCDEPTVRTCKNFWIKSNQSSACQISDSIAANHANSRADSEWHSLIRSYTYICSNPMIKEYGVCDTAKTLCSSTLASYEIGCGAYTNECEATGGMTQTLACTFASNLKTNYSSYTTEIAHFDMICKGPDPDPIPPAPPAPPAPPSACQLAQAACGTTGFVGSEMTDSCKAAVVNCLHDPNASDADRCELAQTMSGFDFGLDSKGNKIVPDDINHYVNDFNNSCPAGGQAVLPKRPVGPDNPDPIAGVCAEDIISGGVDPAAGPNPHRFSSLNIFNLPCLSDQSVAVLKQVFGNAINTFESGVTVPDGYLIPEFLRHFNTILLTLVILIYSFILLIGTLNSAHEGTFLGKDWSSIWTPVRAIAGPLLIVPSKATGLCGAQMIVLYLILLGVNMGTAVWSNSVKDVNAGISPTVPTAMFGQVKDAAGQSFLSYAVAYIMYGDPANLTTASESSRTVTFTPATVQIGKLTDGVLFDDIKGSMKNLCLAAYDVFPNPIAADQNPLPSGASVKTGTVSSIGELPNAERLAASTCLNNVESMFNQGPSIYNMPAKPTAEVTYMPNYSQISGPQATANAGGNYWVAMVGDNLWTAAGLTCTDGNCFPPARFVDDGANGIKRQPWGTVCHGWAQEGGNPVGGHICMWGVNMEDAGSTHVRNLDYGYAFDLSSPEAFSIDANNKVSRVVLHAAPITYGAAASAEGPGFEQNASGNVALTGDVVYQPPQDSTAPLTIQLNKSLSEFVNANVMGDKCNLNNGLTVDTVCENIGPITSAVVKAAEEAMAQAQKDAPETESSSVAHDATVAPECYPEDSWITKDDKGRDVEHYAKGKEEICKLVNASADRKTIDQVDKRLDSSWWYAGQVYLQLDQKMANNLGLLNSKLQQLSASKSAPHFVARIKATTKILVIHAPGFYGDNDGGGDWGGDKSLENYIKTESTLIFQYSTPNGVKSYGPYYDHLAFEDAEYHYQSGQGLTGWNDDLLIITSSAGYEALDSQVKTGLMTYLSDLPATEQLPIQAFARSSNFRTASESEQKTQLQQLYRALSVLDFNGFLQSPSQVASDLPAKKLMDKILGNLLGGDSRGVSDSLSGIMNEVYSFGNVSMSGGTNLVGKNLSVIVNAQRVGVDCILAVIDSMNRIYKHFEDKTDDMVKTIQGVQIASTTISVAANITAAIFAGTDMAGGPFFHSGGAATAAVGIGETASSVAQFVLSFEVLKATNQMSQQMMYLPLVLVIMVMMFTVGVTLALMLPLTPFILFWGGQMAWILGCIEAMVAAPLLALALTYPGGHQVFGHTMQGLRLLMGVIFRPVLMIMGVLIAMVLTYIIITLSAQGFHLVASAIIGGAGLDGTPLVGMIPHRTDDPDDTAKGIIALFLLFIYSQFIMKAFNKCFSAIYVLPEKVMQYVGGQADRAGADDLQELSSGLTQATQQVGGAGQQGMQSGVQGRQSYMEGSKNTGLDNLGVRGSASMAQSKVQHRKEKHDSNKGKESKLDGGN